MLGKGGGGGEQTKEIKKLPQPGGGGIRGRRYNKGTLGETVLQCETTARTRG
jgi:hypothetical protein